MNPLLSIRPGLQAEHPCSGRTAAGFTLIEMLMCLTMLALIMLPFTVVIGSISTSSRSAYLQSTRTILLNSLKGETTPTDPTYVTDFTDSAMDTSITDSGQAMPFRRTVDATTANATNSMKRTTHFYLYRNSTDASSSPMYKTSTISYPKIFRTHFGNATDVIDTLGRYWYSDNFGDVVYNTTNKVPGWASSKPTASTTQDILNTSGNDDQLFQTEVAVTSGTYEMDVENGAYTVKVLWCEIGTAVNATTYRRRSNVYLQDVKMTTTGPYSAFESTGGLYYAQMTMYDTNVTDGLLRIKFVADSNVESPNSTPNGIIVIRRSSL